jgi:hypothetical protein
MAAVHNDRWGLRLPIWVTLSTGGVFSGVLIGKCTADPECSSPTYYTSIDAVSVKINVPLEGLDQRYISPHLEVIPKTPHFTDGNRDFQLKRLPAYRGRGTTYEPCNRTI